MPQSKNKHVIFVEKNNHPSRFLLDLQSPNLNSANNNHANENNRSNTRILGDVFVHPDSSEDNQNNSHDFDSQKNELKHEKIFQSVHQRAKKLTFFPLLFVVFQLIKIAAKFCYGIGLIVVFFIRLPLAVPLNLFRLFLEKNQLDKEVEDDENEILHSIYNDKIPQEKFSAKAKQKITAVDWLKPLRILSQLAQKIKPKLKSRSKLHLASDIKFKPPIKLKLKRPGFKRLHLKASSQPLRAAGLLALSMIVLILPFKAFTYYKNLDDLRDMVLGTSESAVASIKDGAELASNKDFYGASANFAKASQDFSSAQKEVKDISDLLALIAPVIPNKDIKMAAQADLILEAGKLSAKIAEELSMALSGLSGQENDKGQAFTNFFQYSQVLKEDAKKLSEVLQKIDTENLPDEYREKFSVLQEKMVIVEKNIDELADLANKLYIALGFNADKRYLVVFQNNTEMRGSGGFIGSYALVDFSNGQIKNIEVPGGGSYDTEWGMVKKIVAPEALSIINPRWYFWDANWWPDWPTSARKLEWFYEQSERRTVDGVISLTPTAFEKILSIIGPIDMQAKYGLTFTADNFWELTQDLVEQKPAYSTSSAATTTPKNEPKKIIGDLLEKIRQDLPSKLNQQISLALLQAVEESIEQRHVLLYFNEEELEAKAAEYGADGGIKSANWDYLMVADTNIAGGKSDKKIKEEISHTAEIQADGTVIDTVMIRRTHQAEKNEEFVGVRNNDWMRVYVPLGSELLEASGFSKPDDIYFSKPERDWEKDYDVVNTEGQAVIHTESGTKIYEENGKTVFANWSQVDPGSYTTIYLKYRLPFKVKATEEERVGIIDYLVNYFNPNQKELLPYALLTQKQPGSISTSFKSQMTLADNYEIVWSYSGSDKIKENGWSIEDILNTDKYFAALITAK